MTIETKFNVGDTAFVLYENRIYEVTVTGISYFTEYNNIWRRLTSEINYRIKFPAGGETKLAESRLFATKQDLLESL